MVILFEYTYSWAVLREPRHVRVAAYQTSSQLRTTIVLPGFCNPAREFGQGMKRILGRYGPMLVVHYNTRMRFDEIYVAIMAALKKLNGPRELFVYGHSMGGPLGEQFHERYEREGSPYGPIRELVLDCPPSTGRSLAVPAWVRVLLRAFLKFYWGGPIGALLLALGNRISRKTMPAPLSASVDRDLYRRYARGLMLPNNRAAVAQLKYMLRHKMPKLSVITSTRVLCIGAKDWRRDGLVRQNVAILDWKRTFKHMKIVLCEAVGHAWPMEQPEAYDRIIRNFMRLTAS
jgi:pimeloyl-ACP methyl ester carboxylesterase